MTGGEHITGLPRNHVVACGRVSTRSKLAQTSSCGIRPDSQLTANI